MCLLFLDLKNVNTHVLYYLARGGGADANPDKQDKNSLPTHFFSCNRITWCS